MQRFHGARSARPTLIPLGTLALAACAAPAPTTLDVASAEASVASRGTDARLVDDVLALVDLEQLALPAPTSAALADPTRAEFWHACAWTWNSDVRRTRRALLASRAAESSAGVPAPVGLQAVDHELGGDDDLIETVAVFDLIGLFGVGPAAAARELANAQSLALLGAFEVALWNASIDVRRARLALSAARARVTALAGLLAEARADEPRVEVLARHGRLAVSVQERAAGRIHAVERALSAARELEIEAQAALARTSGLPPTSSALAAPSAADLADLATLEPGVVTERSFTHPVLRARRLEFALAEARVRRVAAEAWPGLAFGPHLSELSGLNLGAVLRVSLPWPASWRGRLAAAEEERTGAQEAFEDALVVLLADEHAAATRLAEARMRGVEHTTRVEAASAADWRAMRARFRSAAEDAGAWSDALSRRLQTLHITIDDQELVARVALDLLAARGPSALGVTR